MFGLRPFIAVELETLIRTRIHPPPERIPAGNSASTESYTAENAAEVHSEQAEDESVFGLISLQSAGATRLPWSETMVRRRRPVRCRRTIFGLWDPGSPLVIRGSEDMTAWHDRCHLQETRQTKAEEIHKGTEQHDWAAAIE